MMQYVSIPLWLQLLLVIGIPIVLVLVIGWFYAARAVNGSSSKPLRRRKRRRHH